LPRRGLGGPEQCSRLIWGGWEGKRLTGVGCPRWRVGDRSAQRRQIEGEVVGVGGDVGEQQDASGVPEEVAMLRPSACGFQLSRVREAGDRAAG
jgi:hypothetical protein